MMLSTHPARRGASGHDLKIMFWAFWYIVWRSEAIGIEADG
jgi:hypothetical protein